MNNLRSNDTFISLSLIYITSGRTVQLKDCEERGLLKQIISIGLETGCVARAFKIGVHIESFQSLATTKVERKATIVNFYDQIGLIMLGGWFFLLLVMPSRNYNDTTALKDVQAKQVVKAHALHVALR